MYIDTHIHLQDFKSNNATDIVQQMLSQGVEKVVCVSAIEEDWQKVAKLHEQFPQNVVPAFGLHPWYVKDAKKGWEKRLVEYLQKYPTALIGETGLDRLKDENYEPQNASFKVHLAFAKVFRRPLLIHAVKCQDWLEEYWSFLPNKFVFHSYSGKAEIAKKIVANGGYISFSSSILRKQEIDATLQGVPKNRILLETDGPYQGDMKIKDIADGLASFLGQDQKSFATQIYKNSEEFIKVGK